MARELTKLFETIHSCSLGEAYEWMTADANRQRGEFVLLVSAAKATGTTVKASGFSGYCSVKGCR